MVCETARLASRGGDDAGEFRLGLAMRTVSSLPGSRPEPELPPPAAP